MSKIPAPTTNDYSNYGSYPYGESLRRSMAGDGQDGGYSSFGVGGQSSDVQSYIQYMHRYEQMLQSYRQTHTDPQSIAMVDQYLATSHQYLQEIQVDDSSWGYDVGGNFGTNGFGMDPSNGLGASSNGGTASQYGEMIWQDSTRVKWDGTDPVVYPVNQQSDSRGQDFFQGDVMIQIPYHGAKANAVLVDDDSVTGAKMLKVSVTMDDGSTRVFCVHNVTDKSNIHLQSVDPSNITLDASVTGSSVAGQITAEEISDPSTASQPMGDQPVKRKDGKMGYDGSSFDICSPGDSKDYYVSARNDVHFHAASNTEYWTVEWDDSAKQYLIKTYNDEAHTKVTNTYHVDDMTNLKMTFDIDPTHIEFLKNGTVDLGATGDTHSISTSEPHAQKLSMDSGDGSQGGTGEAVNSLYPNDTPADNVSGKTATYNTSQDVEIHSMGQGRTYNITAPGTVTLHGMSYSDTMEVKSYDAGPPQKWTIVVHKDGKSDAATDETFNITGGSDTTVSLDVMDQSSITGPGASSVQIGTGSGTSSGGVGNSGDTPPTSKSGKDWTYTKGSDGLDLHAAFDHDKSTINTTGDFTLHFTDTQNVSVEKAGDTYTITVTEGSKTIAYNVKAKNINLDGNELNVSCNGNNSAKLKLQADPHLLVQGMPIAKTQKSRESLGDALINGANVSDGDLGFTGGDQNDQVKSWTSDMINKIGEALKSNDWSDVQSAFSRIPSDSGWKNNSGEVLFWELRGILGGSNGGEKILKQIVSQMSSGVTSAWKAALSERSDEINSTSEVSGYLKGAFVDGQDSNWTHQSTIDFITQASSSGSNDD